MSAVIGNPAVIELIMKAEKIIIFLFHVVFIFKLRTILTVLLWGLATKERKGSVASNQRKWMVIPELNILQITIFPIFGRSAVIE